MARKPNPVYQRGVEEGEKYAIAKSSRKIMQSIEDFSKKKGIGAKTMAMLYESFGLDPNLSDEEEKELDKKWGRYNAT